MTVRAVETYNHDRSAFPIVLGGTAAGMGAGYAVKYILPVTENENNFSRKAIINSSRKIANQNMVNEIQAAAKTSKSNLTLAQDTFVKMIEGKKGNDGFLAKNVTEKVKQLNKKVPGAGKEYENIITMVNEAARTKSERLIKACKIMVKSERPLAGFLVPGAIIGLIAGAFVNAFRDSKEA